MIENFPFTIYDLVLVGFILLVGLLGLAWGLAGVITRLGAWSGAVTLSLILFPKASPLAHGYFQQPLMADIVTAAVLFALSLIALLLLAGAIAGAIRNSPLGPLDRALGFSLGLGFGYGLAALGLVSLTLIMGNDELPTALKSSRSYEVLIKHGTKLSGLIPTEFVTPTLKALQQTVEAADKAHNAHELYQQYTNPKPQNPNLMPDGKSVINTKQNAMNAKDGLPNTHQQGYSQSDRNGLNQLIKTTP